jgi:hypothetical protein
MDINRVGCFVRVATPLRLCLIGDGRNGIFNAESSLHFSALFD